MRSIYNLFRRQKAIDEHTQELIAETDESVTTIVDSGERMEYEPDEVEFDDEDDDWDDEDDVDWMEDEDEDDEDDMYWGDDDEDDDDWD